MLWEEECPLKWRSQILKHFNCAKTDLYTYNLVHICNHSLHEINDIMQSLQTGMLINKISLLRHMTSIVYTHV